jgi:hypothetical protein
MRKMEWECRLQAEPFFAMRVAATKNYAGSNRCCKVNLFCNEPLWFAMVMELHPFPG